MDLYFDCFSGISGDMTMGALIDLGVPLDWLEKNLSKLPLDGVRLVAEPVVRNGISAVNITVSDGPEQHARDYAAIRKLIRKASLPERVRHTALAMFEKIAIAESEIHRTPPDHVHFHEVGGVDAIMDIVGVALCLDYLRANTVRFSPLPLGSGFVTCSHGRLPVPAPATVAILNDIPVTGSDIECELVTPTGAAIAATLSDGFGPLPAMRISCCGYGAGDRDLSPHPNLLRILGGTFAPDIPTMAGETVCQLETAIDDMNPEIYGYLMERLFDEGALDVCWFPLFMKKNRPGTMIQVLCHPDLQPTLCQVLLTETTSLGVRVQTASRSVLPRRISARQTRYGRINGKEIDMPGGETRWTPEYDFCRSIARERGIPLRQVYEKVLKDSRDGTGNNGLTKPGPDYRDGS